MLYDKRWDKTYATPSRAGFVSWLGTQNPQAHYQFMPACTCAIGQYLTSIGLSYTVVARSPMVNEIFEWNDKVTRPKPWTFGAALARAKALQP